MQILEKQIKNPEFYLPLFILIVGSIVCFFTDLDLTISGFFYDHESQTWPELKNPFVEFGNRYGPAICALFLFWAGIRLFLSYLTPTQTMHRLAAYLIILSFLIGPLFIVHAIFKENWRRPRPRDVIEFNGNHEFRKVFLFGKKDFDGKSFPSGHASVGFILVVMYFIFKNRSKNKARFFLALGLGMGLWLSFDRVASGAHFFSDVLWAFGINWFLVYALYYLWYLPRESKPCPHFESTTKRKIIAFSSLILGLTISALPFMMATPIKDKYPHKTYEIPQGIKRVLVKGRIKKGNIHGYRWQTARHIQVESRIDALGIPGLKTERDYQMEQQGDLLILTYQTTPSHFLYLEYQSHHNLILPQGVEVEWDLKTELGKVFIHPETRVGQ